MMNTDRFILEFLAWCHANPITVTLAMPVLWAVAKRTRTTYDDWLLRRLSRATGQDRTE